MTSESPASRARLVAAALVGLLAAGVAPAHVNSPHIYLEEAAGPWPVIVVVHMPPAVPGEAELQVRLHDRKAGEAVEVHVQEVPPEGEHAAPPWVRARASEVDPDFFVAPVPLMTFGVWKAKVRVTGSRGEGTIELPIHAKVPAPRSMDPRLSGVLIGLAALLLVSLWQIGRGLGRDAHREARRAFEGARRRRGLVWAGALSVSFVAVLAFHLLAWDIANDVHERRAGRGLASELAVVGGAPPVSGERLSLRLVVRGPKGAPLQNVVQDHGKMMHLVAVKLPEAGYFLHVHPKMIVPGVFAFDFVPPEGGTYRFFADLLFASGIGETVTQDLVVAEGTRRGEAAFGDPDDSDASQPGLGELPRDGRGFEVGDGLSLRWVAPADLPMAKGQLVKLAFELERPDGTRIDDLEPYMGMTGHLLIVREDAGVFAHVHPMGTLGGRMGSAVDHGDPDAHRRHMAAMAAFRPDPGRVTFPYGFPEPGVYRLFVQVKHSGRVYTAVFDTEVL